MKIRGHHLFCMNLFSGHGYDRAFTENMERIIGACEGGELLQICIGQDAVCAACPNLQPEGGCDLGTEDVENRDKAACRVLGLPPGRELSWEQVFTYVLKLKEADFQAVCGGCRWAEEGLCSYSMLMERMALRS